MWMQRVRVERAVAVGTGDDRAVDRRAHPLPRSAALAGAGVGRQQVHQETARAARHRQQRTARLPVTRAFRPRTGQSVTHGRRCDAGPTVTFPTVSRNDP